MNPIEITTPRLLLKPLNSEFFATVNEYALDYENTKYMLYLPNDSEAETAKFLREAELAWQKECPDAYEFAILYQDQHVGAVSLYLEGNSGELGWIVNKKYWRQGFAYEAADALMKYFVEHMGITHFVAHCDAENVASYRVMEKLGMKKTGEWGGRRNRFATEDSMEYQYECYIEQK